MSHLPVLRRLQRLWVVFLAVVIAIMAVLPVLDADPSDLPVALSATLAVAGGIGAFIAITALEMTFAASPPTGDERALREYEARTTLGFAIALAPAVLGFALAFAFGQLTPAAIGGGAAIACLLRARPSLVRLQRLERTWADNGHDVAVLRAARGEQPPADATQPEPDPAPDTQGPDHDDPDDEGRAHPP